jgi:hypothetical protein
VLRQNDGPQSLLQERFCVGDPYVNGAQLQENGIYRQKQQVDPESAHFFSLLS